MTPRPTSDEDHRYHDEAEFAAGWETGWSHPPGEPPPPNPHTDARGKARWELGFREGLESKRLYLETKQAKIEREAEDERRKQARWKRSGRYNPTPEE